MDIQDFVDQIYNIFKKNATTSKLQGLLDMAKSKLSDVKYQQLVMGGIYYAIMYGKSEYIDVLTNEYQIGPDRMVPGPDVNNVIPILEGEKFKLNPETIIFSVHVSFVERIILPQGQGRCEEQRPFPGVGDFTSLWPFPFSLPLEPL